MIATDHRRPASRLRLRRRSPFPVAGRDRRFCFFAMSLVNASIPAIQVDRRASICHSLELGQAVRVRGLEKMSAARRAAATCPRRSATGSGRVVPNSVIRDHRANPSNTFRADCVEELPPRAGDFGGLVLEVSGLDRLESSEDLTDGCLAGVSERGIGDVGGCLHVVSPCMRLIDAPAWLQRWRKSGECFIKIRMVLAGDESAPAMPQGLFAPEKLPIDNGGGMLNAVARLRAQVPMFT